MISMEDIDWSEYWINTYSQANKVDKPRDYDPNFWDKFSEKYAKYVLNNEKATFQINENVKRFNKIFNLDKNTTILEIGPGPGTYTIPLAKIVKKITVVEPAEGMAKILLKRAKEENLDNITIIPKRWDDVELNKDFEKHDLVFSSYSLIVDDMGESLLKMNESKNKYCGILTSADFPVHKDIYCKIGDLLNIENSKKAKLSLSHILLLNILDQYGIPANVNVYEGQFYQYFESIDEAFSKYITDYDRTRDLKLSENQKDSVKELLSKILTKNEDRWEYNMDSKEALIWW
ncbi:ubiquinone/menaquinone biosynthesis C-methylase UbiE [Methanococcus voltae PS]|uniref:Ubiquinone/menaquinone biosynthesis C-methylase UbiE n=1 Tax=Methanococcus voltae PS TaxID=523842 RepID=A0ABT2EXS2_METVO|nr:rRNA adenine N-6-methyltransferase family protein [Methanococcus voltae]MCS3922760.1 ubiquinone/menaquinone biosynthesis C-methylase UbiE [Methanococcus voltae PS]